MMRYLFGDSTPFPFAHNFLDTLTAVTETCVALLHLDADAVVLQRASRRRRAETQDELARLDLLRDRLDDELAGALAGEGNDSVSVVAARLANELERAYGSARETIANRQQVPLPSVDASAPLRLLERLLIGHELPDTRWALQWRTACGDDTPTAVAACAGARGLEAELSIGIPVDHVLAEPVRLRQIVPRDLEVHVDRVSLRELFVTRIAHDEDGVAVRVQETPRSDSSGFHLEFPAAPGAAPSVHCVGANVRVLVSPERAGELSAIGQRVAAVLDSVRPYRTALLAASLDGVPIAQVERPRVVVEALVASIGPLVRELCERSKVPGEITLKRERRDGQRDELFIPQAELLAKLRGLSPEDRALFGPYGLEGASDLITAEVRRLDLPLRASPHHDV